MKRKGEFLSDIMNIYTGEHCTYRKATKLKSGANITDANCDGVLIRKLGSEYFRINYGNIVKPEWFGAKGDGVTDDTIAIQRAFDVAEVSDTVLFEDKVYIAKELNLNKVVHLKGTGNGKWFSRSSQLKMKENGAYLLKIGRVSIWDESFFTFEAIGCENIVFHGNNKIFSDACLVLEGLSSPNFSNTSIHYVQGVAKRMRIVFEPVFQNFMLRNIVATTLGAVYFDQIYNNDDNANVNNVNYRGNCHFERNVGTLFASHVNSNLDVLRILGSKFEWGLDTPIVGAKYPLFNFEQGNRIDIAHNHFTNFNFENGYTSILKLGRQEAIGSFAVASFTDNTLLNITSTTNLVENYGTSTVTCVRNENTSFNGQQPALINKSRSSINFEYPKLTINSIGNQATLKLKNEAIGLISAHRFAHNTNLFVEDVNSKVIEQTVLKTSLANQVLLNLPPEKFISAPYNLLFAVRCKSETGAGKIGIVIGTELIESKTITHTNYANVLFVIPKYRLNNLSTNLQHRLRIITLLENTENVYVDGFYLQEGFVSSGRVTLTAGTATITDIHARATTTDVQVSLKTQTGTVPAYYIVQSFDGYFVITAKDQAGATVTGCTSQVIWSIINY